MDEKLIEEVKKYDILFNLESSGYKDVLQKEEIWKTISNTLNTSADSCKKRWKNLRDTYRRNKQKEYVSSGSEATFKRRWKYADQMRFLENVKNSRSTIGNAVNPLEIIDLVGDIDNIIEDRSNLSSPEPEIIRPSTSRKKITMDEVFSDFVEIAKSAFPTTAVNCEEKNNMQLLFEYLIASIADANLSKSQSNYLEEKIFSLVKYELAKFKNN